MLPFDYMELTKRFRTIRPWAAHTLGDQINRCAVCMGYTLKITPSGSDATLADIPDVSKLVSDRMPVRNGPQPVSTEVKPYTAYFFIRAADLLPRVLSVYGKPDVEGVAKDVATRVAGKHGVVYLENCYQTESEKKSKFAQLLNMSSGDHWDLHDGFQMVAEELPIVGNTHRGTLRFWTARSSS